MLRFTHVLAACLFANISIGAFAQTFPERSITLVVPYSAGAGAGDIIGRKLAQKVSEKLGKAMIVDNKPGADATIGAAYVINARPDGYTLLEGDSGPLAIVPAMRKLNFDPADLAPVGPLVALPYALAVSPKLGVKTLADLIKLAKADPNALNYASSSAMSILGMELIKRRVGINVTHIPYSGATGALNSILAGQTSMMVLNPVALKPFLDSGQLIAIAIGSPMRSPVLPDVPTFEQLGVSGVDVQIYMGVFAPPSTPTLVITRLNSVVAEVMRDPAFRKDLESQGAVLLKEQTPAAFGLVMDGEREKWKRLVSEAGIGEKNGTQK
jgi:tripartite-type tricarboxylate transporter receptor subunit TctC